MNIFTQLCMSFSLGIHFFNQYDSEVLFWSYIKTLSDLMVHIESDLGPNSLLEVKAFCGFLV